MPDYIVEHQRFRHSPSIIVRLVKPTTCTSYITFRRRCLYPVQQRTSWRNHPFCSRIVVSTSFLVNALFSAKQLAAVNLFKTFLHDSIFPPRCSYVIMARLEELLWWSWRWLLAVHVSGFRVACLPCRRPVQNKLLNYWVSNQAGRTQFLILARAQCEIYQQPRRGISGDHSLLCCWVLVLPRIVTPESLWWILRSLEQHTNFAAAMYRLAYSKGNLSGWRRSQAIWYCTSPHKQEYYI